MYVLLKVSLTPCKHAWFVVLLGLLTIAHLGAHAAHLPDHLSPETLVTASEGDPVDDHHHDDEEEGHSHLFVPSAAVCTPDGHDAWTPVALVAAGSEQSLTSAPVGRSPPGDYRGRAALTQTLEVCRC